MNRVREETGYSMIELLVVMAILGVVVGGLTTVFVSGSKAELDMNLRFQAQQNARMAFSQLRNDIHLSCTADTSTVGRILLYPAAAAASTASCAAAPTIVWCSTTSASLAGRYALYQASAASCSSPPAGKLYADYLTANTLFTKNTPTAGSKQRMSVTVDLPVSTSKVSAAVDRYELKDTIVMRNSVPG